MERFYSFSKFARETFGEKIYKLSLDGGFTCPNRDGTLGYGGCIFCSEGGSGEFCPPSTLPLSRQLQLAKAQISSKYRGNKFIAYFQAFTNTYAPPEKLRSLFLEAVSYPDISALFIATRPDCLPEETLLLLDELNQKKPVFLELGLQTIHEKTAVWMRRAYPLSVFEDAVFELHKHSIPVITHLILGLPQENREMILETINYINSLPISGVKFTMLHILRGTDLCRLYEKEPFYLLSREEYTDLVAACINHLRADIVIHRMTGDGKRDSLVAPLWTLQKRAVLNTIMKKLKATDSFQGRKCTNCPQVL